MYFHKFVQSAIHIVASATGGGGKDATTRESPPGTSEATERSRRTLVHQRVRPASTAAQGPS